MMQSEYATQKVTAAPPAPRPAGTFAGDYLSAMEISASRAAEITARLESAATRLAGDVPETASASASAPPSELGGLAGELHYRAFGLNSWFDRATAALNRIERVV